MARKPLSAEEAFDAATPSRHRLGSRDTYLADPVVHDLLRSAHARKQKDRTWTWPDLIVVVNRVLESRGKPRVESCATTVAAYCHRKFGHASRR